MSLDPDTFRSVLGRFASGVTIVTTTTPEGRDYGMTVSAFCSVSLSPPMILVCIDRKATILPWLEVEGPIGVSVLSSAQEALSRRFAIHDDDDRFIGVGFRRGGSGCALLDDALAHMECRLVARHDAGDHVLFLGEVEEAQTFDGRPLLYYRGGYAQLER